jgi:AraC-like DNA-binding protein
MPATLGAAMPTFLNDPATAPEDAIRFGAGAPGIERAEVRLASRSFAPHRHDTYAIGLTLAGVQVFRYRGARRVCLPGQLHVLHPDETHDGAPGTPAGFAYRILYVDPERLRGALGDRPLPFVRDPVQARTPVTRGLVGLLTALDDLLDELAAPDAVAAIADALCALAGRPPREGPLDRAAVERARAYLAEHAHEPTPAATLERVSGLDRFALARQFRRAFGTSPDRYRTMRRLALARAAIRDGASLARAAADAGFADQSHLTRQFKRAYGLTPRRWVTLTSGPGTGSGA